MNVRAEVNLMVAGRSWTIEHNDKTHMYELILENQPFLTPAGHPVAHVNERLMFQMVAELRCFRSLDSKLSTLCL